MALPLGKLTILVGAGLFGAIMAKEGRMPTMYDVYTVAKKIPKIISSDGKSTSKPNPKPKVTDAVLEAQVNSLREELKLLLSNRPVTIVTTNGSATTSKFGVIIVVVAVGYGYVWWKGWKLPDMMFATRRSLSDATNAVSKQLENVFSSVAATKRFLSSRIDRVNASLDEVSEMTASIQDEVTGVRDKSRVMSLDIKSVHDAVYSMESKLNRIELMQDDTYIGVTKLLRTAASLENQATADRIQGNPSSSRPALELPQRAMSLPPAQLEELQSSPPVSPKARRPLETAVSSASGLLILHEDSEVEANSTPRPLNGLNVTEDGNSSARVFGRTLSSLSSVFTRARTAAKQ